MSAGEIGGKRQVIDLLVKITQLGEAQRRDARYYNFATYHWDVIFEQDVQRCY
jgi:hypothetical protein